MDYIIEQKQSTQVRIKTGPLHQSRAQQSHSNLLLAKPFAEKSSSVDFVRNASTDGLGVYKLAFKGDDTTEPPASDNWNLTVMHTNDTHAHLDDAARRATKIKEVRAESKTTFY